MKSLVVGFSESPQKREAKAQRGIKADRIPFLRVIKHAETAKENLIITIHLV